MDKTSNPVGVFDSGIGGISTLRDIIRELPREHLIYYGDIANAPYGTKSTEEVIACVRKVVDHLLEKQIKALVIACNTATGAAAATLQAAHTDAADTSHAQGVAAYLAILVGIAGRGWRASGQPREPVLPFAEATPPRADQRSR